MEKDVIRALTQYDGSRKAALCSLVQWKGSVPRKDYPWMLVTDDGSIIGTIGGGRLEYQVIEEAKKIMNSNHGMVMEFKMDGKDVMGDVSICGGKVTVFVEPLTDELRGVFESIQQYQSGHEKPILLTEIHLGKDLKYNRQFIVSGSNTSSYPDIVKSKINRLLDQPRSISIRIKEVLYLLQSVCTSPVLHIFGAGHVGLAVARLAGFLGLDIMVYDDRKDLANSRNFPGAKRILNIAPEDLKDNIIIHEWDFILIAVRGHHQELDLMRWLLKLKCSYLGLMCSRNKWKLLSETLKIDGFSDEQLSRIYAPVGLDIASDTVPEIAFSIMSEIIQHYQTGARSQLSLSENGGN
ncbi:MAG: XdhC family protein [Candidatus Neomarinimicrobiota bacterium]